MRRQYQSPLTYTIDLHTHTYYSDGRASPEELLTNAAKMGIKTLAITDHDNTRGSREAIPFAMQMGIDLIPAIEFTSCWDELPAPPQDVNIDVLGYFIEIDDLDLKAFEKEGLDEVHASIADCCQRMTAAGYPIAMQDVFAQNPHYGGTMFLIDTAIAKGFAADWKTGAVFVDQFILESPLTSHTIEQVIAVIRRAGGVAVLAHPVLVHNQESWLDREWMGKLVDMGLGGIEVYHTRMEENARDYFLKMAQYFNLAVTGGSDDHGWPVGFPRLGRQPVTNQMVEKLRQRTNLSQIR